MSPASRRLRCVRATLVALALSVFALPAAASAATPSLVGDGLHISAGALVDPVGRTWVADHNGGFCRMTDPTEDEPARIQHPETPSDLTTKRTCLGGLMPHAAPGPDAAGQPAFHDPSPEFPNSGDEIAYIPDGASPSADVLRSHWNPDTELFEFDPNVPRDVILMNGDIAEDRPRPVAVSLGPDGNLYVVFQRTASIQRVLAPASATPTVQLVGQTSDADGAGSIAAGRNVAGALTIYVGETVGIRQLQPNPLLPNQVTLPTPFDIGLNDPVNPFNREGVPALTYDADDRILYAGTASQSAPIPTGPGVDEVFRFDIASGTGSSYATGFSMVGGLAMGMGNDVIVVDDPALLDPFEPLGAGRMWRLGPPGARIVAGPTNVSGAQSPDRAVTNDPTPTFQVVGEPDLECSLELDGQPKAWNDCAGGSYTSPSALADGSTYRFAVRANDGVLPGRAHARVFTVDLTAPGAPTIVRPDGTVTLPQRPWFEFASNEDGSSYLCSLDDGTFTACATGRPYAFTNSGSHTLRVREVDRAGNISTSFATLSFDVDGVLPAVSIASTPSGPFTQQQDVTFDYQLTNSEPAGAQFGCRVNEEDFELCGTSPSGSHSFTNLPDGVYRFEVHARDAAGNLGPTVARTVTVDTTAPVVDSTRLRLVTGPSGAFPLSANEPATFECRIAAGPLQACGGSVAFNNLAEGAHVLRIQATDQAGNVASVHTHDFTVSIPDTTPPDVAITAPAAGDQTQPNVFVVFSFDDESVPVTVACTLDGVPVVPCASPQLLTGLPDGFHVFAVTATDADGNNRTVSRVWEVKARGQGGADEAIPPTPVQPPAALAAPNGGQQQQQQQANVALNPLTGNPLALGRLTIAPAPTAAAIADAGLTVTLVADPGTNVVRVRVFERPVAEARQVSAAAKRGKARRKLVATEFKAVKAERRVSIELSKRTRKRLKEGHRYVLEVTPGTSRKLLGVAQTRNFRVRG